MLNPLIAGCGVYSTWKHVPASPKAKPQQAVKLKSYKGRRSRKARRAA